MEKLHRYEVNLQWEHDTKGLLSSPLLDSSIVVATPPDFSKGIAGIWSPEHLYIAAVNSCFMSGFLAVARKARFEFMDFTCNAVGTLEKAEGSFLVQDIILKPTVIVSSPKLLEKALRILKIARENCIVFNSIKTRVHICPNVVVQGQ